MSDEEKKKMIESIQLNPEEKQEMQDRILDMVTGMGMGSIVKKPAQELGKSAFGRIKQMLGVKPDKMMDLAEAADKAPDVPKWENPNPYGVGSRISEGDQWRMLRSQQQQALREALERNKMQQQINKEIIESARSGGEETIVGSTPRKMSLPSVDPNELQKLLGKNVKRKDDFVSWTKEELEDEIARYVQGEIPTDLKRINKIESALEKLTNKKK